MKLRTKSNSIRLRLTQSEVSLMREKKFVREAIHFPANEALIYELKVVNNDQCITASFNNSSLSIGIPEGIIDRWSGSNEVSILASVKLDNEEELSILVEKDFQCLSPRDEDEADMFPNPENIK